jgi:nucleoside-diphosphate kinase
MLQDQEALAAEVTDHQTKHTYLYIFLLCYPWFLCLIGFLCSNQMERTFIAIKPDGVQRGLISEIITRFERKGYKLVGIKVMVPSKGFAQKHYHDLKERPFFNGLCNFLSSGPVVAMVWEGEGVIRYGRKLIGATDPQKSEPGTIRGDLAVVVGRNIIHGSDGPETAKDEISLWFKPEELVSYTSNAEKWIYGQN